MAGPPFPEPIAHPEDAECPHCGAPPGFHCTDPWTQEDVMPPRPADRRVRPGEGPVTCLAAIAALLVRIGQRIAVAAVGEYPRRSW